MHMSDALISPQVGITMLAVSAGIGVYCHKKTGDSIEKNIVPVMGVMGAFVFAAQMINFAIPGTGSSGHIAGGMLLAAILGPYAGFLSMAAILLIQALFFGDGGLLAYGCNVFNLGVFPCFIAYPFIYRPCIRGTITQKRIWIGAIAASVTALQLGAFSVVLQTQLSGKIELPFVTFVSFMQPIHLAIGVVEGLITAAVISYVWQARPQLLSNEIKQGKPIWRFVSIIACAALITGGILCNFASSDPDGLEWSMENIGGEITAQSDIHTSAENLQRQTAVMPDYSMDGTGLNPGLPGIIGIAITFFSLAAIAFLAYYLKRKQEA